MVDEIGTDALVVALAAARNGYRRLYPIIFAGRAGRDAAYNNIVLRNADIDEFLLIPGRINLESPWRSFFEKCCCARNPSALYIEGLRLIAQGGPLPDAIQMLWTAAKTLKCAIFAAALVLICSGDCEAANTALEPLCIGHPPGMPLYTGTDLIEAEGITTMIFAQLGVLQASKTPRFVRTWNSATPPCQLMCEKEFCDCIVHCYETEPCTKCFFHEKSFNLCQMI